MSYSCSAKELPNAVGRSHGEGGVPSDDSCGLMPAVKMKVLVYLRRYYGDWKGKDGSSGGEGREQ